MSTQDLNAARLRAAHIVPLNAEQGGCGPALVLLHGWGMNLRVFDALCARLQTRFTTWAIDLPGHGRSPWRDGLTQEDLLASVRAVLPPRPLLLGWSLGGQVALRLGAESVVQARALLLLHSTPRFVRSEEWAWGLAPEVLQGFASRLGRDARQTVFDFVELQVRGSAAAGSTLAQLRAALQEQGMAQAPALQLGLDWLRDQDLRTLARSVSLPALVVGGQYDRVTPPQAQRALAGLLPDARHLELRRAGHATFLSHLDELMPALDAFLDPWSAAA
ncbi:MAG: alpha/beta fold hydrolase [Steroidobacteraceae bacterium]